MRLAAENLESHRAIVALSITLCNIFLKRTGLSAYAKCRKKIGRQKFHKILNFTLQQI